MKKRRDLKMFTLVPVKEEKSSERALSALHYQKRKRLIAKSNKGQQKQSNFFKNQIKEDAREVMETMHALKR